MGSHHQSMACPLGMGGSGEAPQSVWIPLRSVAPGRGFLFQFLQNLDCSTDAHQGMAEFSLPRFQLPELLLACRKLALELRKPCCQLFTHRSGVESG